MKRSPWFNAQRQPPVNGGPDAMYEWRCARVAGDNEVMMIRRAALVSTSVPPFCCPDCEWRGILREHDGPVGVVTGGGM